MRLGKEIVSRLLVGWIKDREKYSWLKRPTITKPALQQGCNRIARRRWLIKEWEEQQRIKKCRNVRADMKAAGFSAIEIQARLIEMGLIPDVRTTVSK